MVSLDLGHNICVASGIVLDRKKNGRRDLSAGFRTDKTIKNYQPIVPPKESEMSSSNNHSRLKLPDRMENKLKDFQRKVRIVKLAEGLLAAAFGLLVSYLLVFALDRVFDTPGWGADANSGCRIARCRRLAADDGPQMDLAQPPPGAGRTAVALPVPAIE